MEPNETPQNQSGETADTEKQDAEIAKSLDSTEPTEALEVSGLTVRQRASKIRRMVSLGKSCTEICEALEISRSQYRYAMLWMTHKTFNSNLEAFSRYEVATQARLERMEIDMMAARQSGDFRAVAAIYKLAQEAHDGMIEVGLKLGILDREAIKIQATIAEVGFGDESQSPWFARNTPKDTAAEVVQ